MWLIPTGTTFFLLGNLAALVVASLSYGVPGYPWTRQARDPNGTPRTDALTLGILSSCLNGLDRLSLSTP